MTQAPKAPIPNISEIFNSDGTLDVKTFAAGMMHAFGQHVAGHTEVSNGKASQTTNGKVTHITISFDRTEI